jgi:hypothetical protein
MSKIELRDYYPPDRMTEREYLEIQRTARLQSDYYPNLSGTVWKTMAKTPTFQYGQFSADLQENGDLNITLGGLHHNIIPRAEVFKFINQVVTEMSTDKTSKIPNEVQNVEKEKAVSSLRRHLITLEPTLRPIRIE